MLIEVETIEEYLAALPENRKEVVERLAPSSDCGTVTSWF